MLLKTDFDFINSLFIAATMITTIIAILYGIKTYNRDRHKIIVRHSYYVSADKKKYIKIFVANVGRQPTTISDVGVLGSNVNKDKLLKFNKKLVKKDLKAYQGKHETGLSMTKYSGLAIEDDKEPFIVVMPGTVAGQPTIISEEWAESLKSVSKFKYVWAYAEDIERRLTFSVFPIF